MSRILPDWIDGFMEFTGNSEPPELFRRWTSISVIASALRRKCFLPWGSLTFYPNMYIVLVAPSGKARKGTAMGPGMDFITGDGLGIKLAAEAITREALIRELKNSSDNVTDTTTGQWIFHASLTVYSQELTVFLGYRNYNLMADLTDWYDCRRKWTYRTKWSGTDEIEGVWCNLFGATTPELIQASMPVDAIGLGLTSRMIFVYEERKGKIVPDPFWRDEEMEMKRKLIMDLEQIAMMAGEFSVTDDFVGYWTEWYVAQEDRPPFVDSKFNGYFERRPTHVMKLSMVLNAARTDSMIISDVDLRKAIQILEATEIKMPNTFSGVGKSSQAEVLSKAMAEIGNRGRTTFSDLMNKFRNDVNSRELEQILDSLEAMKYCTVISNTGEIIYNTEYRK